MKKLILVGLVVSSHLFSVPGAMANYTATVNPGTIWNDWEGWGCSLCWWGKSLGTNTTLSDLLFTTNYVTWDGASLPGLKMTVVRYNVGACSSNAYNGHSMSVPRLPTRNQIDAYWTNGVSTNPASSSWSWLRDGNQRAALLNAQARGANKFELFANSPPWWMLSNYDPAGSANGTSDNLNSTYYDTDAIYLATVANYARTNWGLTFTSVEAFNEPSSSWWVSTNTQEGCHFDGGTMASVISYLRTELDRQGLDASKTIVSASDENTVTGAATTWNGFNAATQGRIGRINAHGYGYGNAGRSTLYSLAHSAGVGLWNSEYGENDTSGTLMVSNINLDLTTLHNTAWCYWQPFDGSNWGLLNCSLPSPPTTANVKYYALAQYSRHILPGMQIMDGGNPNVIAAYDWVHTKLVLVAANFTSPQSGTYSLANFPLVAGPVTRWQTNLKGGSDRYHQYNDVTLSGKQFTLSLPTNTVETFEIQNVVAPGMAVARTRDDFNGDGRDDYAFFRPADATWHVVYGSDWNTNTFQFGTTGDMPVLDNDLDHDGFADAIVFRPSTSTWYIRDSSGGTTSFVHGTNGDIPLMGGDFDGDGIPDCATWRPADGTWHIRYSTEGNGSDHHPIWGINGDIPLLNGDFDGDGIPDLVTFRPSNSTWYIRYSGGGTTNFQFGTTGDVPVLGGDYDADGIPDATIFRPADGTWHIRYSSEGNGSDHSFSWGTNGDIPWTSYTTSDRALNQNLYRPSTGTFYLRNAVTGVTSTVAAGIGTSTDIPVH